MEEKAKEAEESEEQKRKREKNLEKQVVILFIVLALVFVSYLLTSSILKDAFVKKPYFEYEGLKVYKSTITGVSTLFYVIPIVGENGQRADIILRYDPRTLDIPIDIGNKLELYGITEVWVTMPPNISSSAVLAGNDLGAFTTKIGLKTDYALTKSNSTFPERTCANATENVRVFMLDIGNETKVFEQGDCVMVQGDSYDNLIRAADALVVKWLLDII